MIYIILNWGCIVLDSSNVSVNYVHIFLSWIKLLLLLLLLLIIIIIITFIKSSAKIIT